jgi:long-subunit fatty acid transport protein
MLKRHVVSCFMVLLTAASVAVAQEDWNITGAGARAEGLGGAFIGLADDATAISWNPSGLGQLERTEFSAVGRWIGEKYEFDNPNNTDANYSITQSHFTYNFASIAFPLHAGQVNIVPAVAFQRQLDNFSDYSTRSETYESGGGVNTITPGIGLKLHPMFYVGGAVNIWLGNFDNKTLEKGTNATAKNDGSYKGLNFTAGLLVDFEGLKKPIPIKIGASLRTPFELEVEGDYEWTTAGTSNTKGSFKNTVEVPLMFGVGASGRIGENLTLSFDFETRMYGDKKIYRTTDKAPVDTIKLSDSGDDVNQIRVGAEYLIVSSAGVIPIRAGFRTVPTLRANVNEKDEYSDQVTGKGFTVGTGFIGGSIALDVTYARTTWEQTFALTGGKSANHNYTNQTVSASVIIYF